MDALENMILSSAKNRWVTLGAALHMRKPKKSEWVSACSISDDNPSMHKTNDHGDRDHLI